MRGVSSCAGMMIRPRTEGLDVTFNVTQSQTWRHYVRALHQFLEREYTGRGLGGVGRHWGKLGRSWKGTWGVLGGDQRVLGQTEGALEWTGLYWEGPSPYWEALGSTRRALVHTGRHWGPWKRFCSPLEQWGFALL